MKRVFKNGTGGVIGFTLALLCASAAHAQSVQLPPGSIFDVRVGQARFKCGQVSNRWVPGTLKGASSFTPFSVAIKNVKRNIRSASAAQLPKLQNKLAKLKSKNAKAKGPCAAGPGGTPTPAPTATPRPNATPTPPPGCFNGADTNCFGIPSGVTGNVNRGASAWLSNGCQGCHSEKRNLSFQRIQGSFMSQPTMFGLPIPNTQTLADITAWLNRFNQ